MGIDLATFRTEFPEFNDAPDPLVSAYLARAITLTPDGVWGGGGLTEAGTLVRCAQLLAQSPFARKMALGDKAGQGRTVYDTRLDELKMMVSSGNRVL